MGSKTLVYRIKVEDNLKESLKHLKRLDNAFGQLMIKYKFPLEVDSYKKILDELDSLAYSDQIIYRFAKLQDVMGAKLFKSLLLYQGENVNRPFLDILNSLEKMDIIEVDDWFEIRDLRNEISHDYEESDGVAINILNSIYLLKDELKIVLEKIDRIKRGL